MLTFSADQTPPYPQQRKQSASLGPLIIDGSQQEYVVQSGLPYADNQVTVYAFNIKLGVQGPSETVTHRSLAIGEFDMLTMAYTCTAHYLLLLPQQLQNLLQ